MILILIASMALADASTVAQATPAPPATQPQGAARGKRQRGDRVICKREVNNTGSRIRAEPVCMLKRDWDRQERIDSDAIRGVQNGSQLGNRVPGSDGT